MIKLSPRLAAAAELAGRGESVIDVGTDHGYLPVYFARNGLFGRVAASDINPGPLDSARRSARAHGVEDRIDFYLSDGLKSVPGTFETVVIAGMGGETAADILTACPWIAGARLVLQPQSRVDKLAAYLDGAGFVCERAVLCLDGGKPYLVLRAAAGPGGFDPARALIDGRDPLLEPFAERERGRVQRALTGMERGEAPDGGQLAALREKLSRLETILKETKKWQN